MTPDETKARVEHCVKRIALPIYEGVTVGVAEAEMLMASIPHREDYGWLASGRARVGMRNYWLDQAASLGAWSVGGEAKLMGQTLLINEADGLELRLLKERKTASGSVPHAGHSGARREYWQAPLIGFPPFTFDRDPAETIRLLLLWSRITVEGHLATRVRVVHTTEAGQFGKRVPVDMSFGIQPGGELFDQLAFTGDSQEDDFFGFEADEGEIGDGGR